MCIGIPMRIVESGEGYALGQPRGSDETTHIDTLLVGDLPKDSWVLVFLGAAREVLDQQTAYQISDALSALDIAMHSAGDMGEQTHKQIDHLFADLVDREPQLPDFLQAQLTTNSNDKEPL